MLGVQELVIILLIVVMVFGAKRIPEIMSGLGQGIKSFKKAVEGDDTSEIRGNGAGSSPETPLPSPKANDGRKGDSEKAETKHTAAD